MLSENYFNSSGIYSITLFLFFCITVNALCHYCIQDGLLSAFLDVGPIYTQISVGKPRQTLAWHQYFIACIITL
jgi:hypothetical protein